MYILILLLPFLSFCYSILLGRWLGQSICLIFSIFFSLFSFLLSIFFFYEIVLSDTIVVISLFNWIVIGLFDITFGLYFDFLTSVMLLVITSISFFVHFYSIGYMSHDLYILRFMSFLSLFTFFMIFLVTADNFFQLFIGWEGVGLCSYLLINFWFTRILANKAALKAMIMNRISDVFFILGIALLFLACKTTDFMVVFNLADFLCYEKVSFLGFYIYKLDLICFFFFVGAVGKSAQLGLHTWLPDAMEGPTPVSALLHAATMVTAGVFLIIRTSPFFEFSSVVLNFISIVGLLTAFFSSLVGVFQYDIKKLIAFSTCSQLGYMFLSCGFSAYHVAIFHLFNHAFFKALLFLGAGAIIHALGDEQDMRRMGRLLNFIPFTYFVMFIASISIMGFPFLTGFYSKDLLLELVYIRFLVDASFVYLFGVFTAFLTAVYSFKLLLFVFFYQINGFRSLVDAAEDSLFIYVPLLLLGLSSIFIGYIFCDIFVGFGFSFLSESLFFFNYAVSFADIELLSPIIKNLPFFFSIFGLMFAFFVFSMGRSLFLNFSILNFLELLRVVLAFKSFFFFFGYFNVIYNWIFLRLFGLSYYNYNKLIDKGFLEFLGPYFFHKFFRYMSFSISNIHPYTVFYILGCMIFFFLFSIGALMVYVYCFVEIGVNIGLIWITFVGLFFITIC